MLSKTKGFTLIELMIVIAIIAIIAAIAIPGVLAAIRSGNERNGSASLKEIVNAQAMFKQQQRGSMFWVGDVRALYRGRPFGSTGPSVRYVADEPLARADEFPRTAGPWDLDGDGTNDFDIIATEVNNAAPMPKSGYFYGALLLDENGTAYGNAGGGVANNANKFGFYCRPSGYPSSGRQTFEVDASGTVYQRDSNGTAPGAAARRYQTGWNPVQ